MTGKERMWLVVSIAVIAMFAGGYAGPGGVVAVLVLGLPLFVFSFFVDSVSGEPKAPEVPPGYRKVVVRYGVWEGVTWPQNHTAVIELAPVDFPGVIVTFKPLSGGTDLVHLYAADVSTVDVFGDGRSYFGFGFEGAVSASLASVVDRMFAPWDLRVTGPAGEFHLHSYTGPIPGPVVLARVEQRLAEHRWSDEY